MKKLMLALIVGSFGLSEVQASEYSLTDAAIKSINSCEAPIAEIEQVKTNTIVLKPALDKNNGKESCFNYRKKDDEKSASLQADFNSCDCIENNSSEKEKLSLCERLSPFTDAQNKRFRIQRNGLLLQSGLLSQPLMESYRQAKEESEAIYDKNGINFLPGVKRKIEENLARGLKPTGEGESLSDSTVNKAVSCLEKNMKFPKDMDLSLLTNDDESKFIKGQCISPREYLGFNGIPKSNDFFKLLEKTTKFEEKDWDVNQLSERLSSLKKANNFPSEEQKQIETRIRFLRRNPLISNFFSAHAEDFSDNDEFLDKKRLSKIKKPENWNNLKDRKAELLSYIQGLRPSGFCGKEEHDCLAKVGNKQQQQFRKKMAEFFARPENINVTNYVSQQALIKDLVNPSFINRPEEAQLPQSRKSLENILRVTHSKNVDSCYGEKIIGDKLKECTDAFKKYCPLVMMASDAILKDGSQQSEKEIENAERRFMWVEDFDADITKNARLKDLNDKVCNTSRKLKELSPELKKFAENFKLKSEADFFEFQTQYCQKSSSDICKPGHKQELVAFYLDLYGDSSKAGQDSSDNMVQAFKDYIKGNEAVVAVDAARIASVSKTVTDEQRDVIAKGAKDAVTKEMARKDRFAFLDVDGSNLSQFSSMAENLLPSKTTTPFAPTDSSSIFNNETFANMLNPSSIANNSMLDRSIDQVEKKHEETKEEKEEIKRSISETKKEMEKVSAPSDKKEFEDRISELEKKLAQKDKNLQEYQNLLNDLNTEKKKRVAESGEDEAEVATKSKRSSTVSSSHESPSDASRTANYNNDFKSTPSSAPVAAVSAGSRSVSSIKTPAAARLNAALLDRYATGLDANSVEALVLINQEKDLSPKAVELLNQGARSQSVTVDSTVYSGVRDLARQQEFLTQHVISKMKGNDAVTMLSVQSKGQIDLQFYVIKMEGKTIVQPIRSARLDHLRNEMKSIQDQAR